MTSSPIYLTEDGNPVGPFDLQEIRSRINEGSLSRQDMAWQEGHSHWIPLGSIPGLFTTPPPLPGFPPPFPVGAHGRNTPATSPEDTLLGRISDYEKISGILWLCLAGVQILSLFGIPAGIWNIFAAISRLDASKRILRRDPEIPKDYEGMAQLIIIAAINLFLGGVIGVAFVAFDFYIRDLILKNTHLFKANAVAPAATTRG